MKDDPASAMLALEFAGPFTAECDYGEPEEFRVILRCGEECIARMSLDQFGEMARGRSVGVINSTETGELCTSKSCR